MSKRKLAADIRMRLGKRYSGRGKNSKHFQRVEFVRAGAVVAEVDVVLEDLRVPYGGNVARRVKAKARRLLFERVKS